MWFYFQYGIVFDAGSSHTSMFIYRWEGTKINLTAVATQDGAKCNTQGKVSPCLLHWYSLLVRAQDSWSKGCKFKSWLEWWESFLLQSHLCVLTFIWCPFRPRVTAVASKRHRPFCQNEVGRLHLNWHIPFTQQSQSGWLCHCPGIVCEPIWKRAHMQPVRKHLVTVISARWATVDESWPK